MMPNFWRSFGKPSQNPCYGLPRPPSHIGEAESQRKLSEVRIFSIDPKGRIVKIPWNLENRNARGCN
jgi:hypothetical protein